MTRPTQESITRFVESAIAVLEGLGSVDISSQPYENGSEL